MWQDLRALYDEGRFLDAAALASPYFADLSQRRAVDPSQQILLARLARRLGGPVRADAILRDVRRRHPDARVPRAGRLLHEDIVDFERHGVTGDDRDAELAQIAFAPSYVGDFARALPLIIGAEIELGDAAPFDKKVIAMLRNPRDPRAMNVPWGLG